MRHIALRFHDRIKMASSENDVLLALALQTQAIATTLLKRKEKKTRSVWVASMLIPAWGMTRSLGTNNGFYELLLDGRSVFEFLCEIVQCVIEVCNWTI